ncbi:MAG: peptidylprolyl isomerase [Rhodothermales bacterium]|nr:peptidylprolyl isomerase [Rhodothermales bacterium]
MLPATNYFKIITPNGDMVIRLYDDTPAHRDNFKKLVAQNYYDGTKFHRVIESFMIQGGDPNSKDDDPMNDGQGGPGYTVPAEIQAPLFHKKGALAAARTGDQINPERESSGSQFYIVQGQVYPEDMLERIEKQLGDVVDGFSYPEEFREIYTTVGGTPSLDMQYTVFGELVEGFDVLDQIAQAPTARKSGDPAHPAVIDRPVEDIDMTIVALEDYEPSAN